MGAELPGGWRVVEEITRGAGQTGGFFSVSYRVEGEDGSPAFLKVLDYEAALQLANDPAHALQEMTRAYLFEVEVLGLCGERRLSRVVLALDSGETFVTGPRGQERISYLVFEIADGDIRQALDAPDLADDAWRLRMLHHACNGMRQLHASGVAHQDLKPSNVLVFEGRSSKVADLGCASVRGVASPRDEHAIAGDLTYAPPELLYSHIHHEWGERRLPADLYHVGGLAVFLFSGHNMTSLMLERLAPEHRPAVWGDSYAAALPFLRSAFNQALDEFESSCPPESAVELSTCVRELCDPDPALRGHPSDRIGHRSRYSLERYVTIFDRLARTAEVRRRIRE